MECFVIGQSQSIGKMQRSYWDQHQGGLTIQKVNKESKSSYEQGGQEEGRHEGGRHEQGRQEEGIRKQGGHEQGRWVQF